MKKLNLMSLTKVFKSQSIDFNLDGVKKHRELVGIIYYDSVFYISEYNKKEKTVIINQLKYDELPLKLVNLINFLFENGKYEIENID